jgi:transcription elongation factor GreA
VLSNQVITRKSFHKLQQTLRDYLEKEQPAIRERISSARDQGDLSENAEYHAAREEMTMLSYKISKLEERLSGARIVDEHEIDTSSVKVFTEVLLMDLDRKKKVVFKLVDPEEMDIVKGKISVASPIAKGLMGKKLGEIAEISVPAGLKRFKILKIDTYFDDE